MTLRSRRGEVIRSPLSRRRTMLVLTRRTGETVHISTDITVTVLEVNGNRIRIGIDAPRQVPIVRGELCRPIGKPPESVEERCKEI
jgi:carbon storage regulator